MQKIQLSREEALANLGWRDQPLDEQMLAELDDCLRLAESALRPRTFSARFPVERTPEGILVCGTDLLLTGRDAAALLEHCETCILFAATAGFEIDRIIDQTLSESKTRALLLDACASAAIEQICEDAQDRLEAAEAERGGFLTFRFAPGYGDLPLEIQPKIVRILETDKRIGVFCGETLLLSPKKSVTALFGVTDRPQPKGEKCSRCSNYAHCAFRKEGKPCGTH